MTHMWAPWQMDLPSVLDGLCPHQVPSFTLPARPEGPAPCPSHFGHPPASVYFNEDKKDARQSSMPQNVIVSPQVTPGILSRRGMIPRER